MTKEKSVLQKADKKRRLVSGVMILTAGNIIVKLIGMIYKVALQRTIGDDGMGYFNCAYTIYDLFLIISTAGLPVALSILISRSRADGSLADTKKIFRTALGFFFSIGAVGCAIIFFLSRRFAIWVGNPAAYTCIAAIAPVLLFICMTSAMRGYFQGAQNMTPTALSQITEAAGKLVFGLLFAYVAIKKGKSISTVAAYVILGLGVASALGMICTFLAKLFEKKEPSSAEGTLSTKSILKALIRTAIPITISASVLAVTNVFDLAVIMRRLQETGLSVEQANNLYGNYTALAVPMCNLPPVLIYPIGLAIIPYISSALQRNDRETAKKVGASSIKACALIGLPCSLGLSLLAGPILLIFYEEESVEKAAALLMVLGFSCFFVGLVSVTNAILQSYSHERLPIISMAAGAAVKLLSSYLLIGKIGIIGAPISSVLCYITISLINMIFVIRAAGIFPKIYDSFVRPFFCALLCAAAGLLVNTLLSKLGTSRFFTLIAIAVSVVVYASLLILLRAIKREELELIPGGKALAKLLCKMKLLK